MIKDTVIGIMIPFIGTIGGSACVLFLKRMFNLSIQKILIGFASGVMVAASVWSLLIPSIELAAGKEVPAVVPGAAGFLVGIFFLLFLDILIPHLHMDADVAEGPKSSLSKTSKMLLAVTLHNIPEGMAVGVIYSGLLSGKSGISAGAALALALGIAIQNFPEGAIVALPLRSEGMSRGRAFIGGVFSGAVEPVSAIITIFATSAIEIALPYLLSFAAGAMMYVVVEELIPEMSQGEHSNLGVISFSIGFVLMMVLDVVLG